MNTKRKNTILLLLAGFIVGVVFYWFKPSYFGDLFDKKPWLLLPIIAFLFSFILGLFMKEKPTRIVFLLTAGAFIAIIGRMIFDINTHDLFPIEIIMYLILIVPIAFVGVYLSVLIKYLRKRLLLSRQNS